MIDKIIKILTVFVLLTACSLETDEEYIAKVGDLKINTKEFSLRYKFNPYLFKYPNPYQAKKVILTSLIAEKMLAQEAAGQTSENAHLHKILFHHHKESMIENYRMDMVEKKILVSEDELKHEYQKACQEVRIQYIAFDSFESANAIMKKIKMGVPFDTAINLYMQGSGWRKSIPERTVAWNTEPYELEELIYGMDVSQVSEPVVAYGGYYLIRVLERNQKMSPSQKDFNNRLSALRDRISRQKIKDEYGKLFHKTIEPYLGQANWEMIDHFLDQMISEEDEIFHKKSSTLKNKQGLSQELYIKSSELYGQNINTISVIFPDGSTWTMQDLIEEMKYGPYAFTYKNPDKFKKNFMQNIQLAMEYEALFKVAQKTGYNKDKRVRHDEDMWKNHYYATDHRYQVIKQAEDNYFAVNRPKNEKIDDFEGNIKLFRINFFDNYLCGLIEKYPVDLNLKLYNNLDLEKKDIVLMKLHFSNRLVSPLVEPLDGLPKWNAKIDSLATRLGIGQS